MADTPATTMRLDPKLKKEANKVLKPLGLTMTGVVTIFLKAIVRKQSMTFDMSLGESLDDMKQVTE